MTLRTVLTASLLAVVAGCSAAPTEPADVPASVAGLAGRSFELVGLTTDAGGADTMFDGVSFVLHFAEGSAVADTSCGRLEYPAVTDSDEPSVGPLTVDLGTPQGPMCPLGTDPSAPPAGVLGFGSDGDGGWYLSTGFVGWRFEEV